MTTAPDLPLGDAAPADAAAPRPLLAVVPEPDGEEIPFETALARILPRLRRYARRRLGDDHDADEVVQEAMLRAHQHRERLATEDDLAAWLTVVTGRLVVDRLRVAGRTTPVAEVPPARAARDTADVVVARDEARIALDSLEAMPARQASVLWAREVEGLRYDEIATRFAMTEASVRSILHRARQTLRREYAARGGTLPAVGLVALAPWLRGLRSAGRLHRVVRHAALTGAVAVTGVLAVAGSPLSIHPAQPTRHAPAVAPAINVRTDVTAVRRSPAGSVSRTTATAPAARPAAPSVAPAAAPARRTMRRLPGPQVCDKQAAGHDVSVGCRLPHASMVRVHLPVTVAGKNYVGVSNDAIDCAAVPTTPVTDCKPGSEETP